MCPYPPDRPAVRWGAFHDSGDPHLLRLCVPLLPAGRTGDRAGGQWPRCADPVAPLRTASVSSPYPARGGRLSAACVADLGLPDGGTAWGSDRAAPDFTTAAYSPRIRALRHG